MVEADALLPSVYFIQLIFSSNHRDFLPPPRLRPVSPLAPYWHTFDLRYVL